jgi:hypothetical protein
MEWRGGEWTGGYEGEKTFERGNFLEGQGEFWREGGRLYWSIFPGEGLKNCIFWFLGWRNLLECYRGASVAGIFGLRGQESSWNPGARESDRICS